MANEKAVLQSFEDRLASERAMRGLNPELMSELDRFRDEGIGRPIVYKLITRLDGENTEELARAAIRIQQHDIPSAEIFCGHILPLSKEMQEFLLILGNGRFLS